MDAAASVAMTATVMLELVLRRRRTVLVVGGDESLVEWVLQPSATVCVVVGKGSRAQSFMARRLSAFDFRGDGSLVGLGSAGSWMLAVLVCVSSVLATLRKRR